MNADKDEIEARIEAARNHKRATYGVGIVVSDVLGDVSDYAVTAARIAELKRRKRNPDAITAEEKRDRQRGYERKYRVIRCSATKQRRGGILGVYEYFRSRRSPRWHASTAHGKQVFDCAIAAAEARNRSIQQTNPGVEELLCDIEAAWDKWGCACGKHERKSK